MLALTEHILFSSGVDIESVVGSCLSLS